MIIKTLAACLKLFVLYWSLFVYQTVLAQSNIPIEYNEYKLNFSSPENAQQKISSMNGSAITTVAFGFDPFAPKLLEFYLPDGYITVNGEYDVNALIIKTFFDPILENDHLKFLIIDLKPFLKDPTQNKIFKVKNLIEALTADVAKKQRAINVGLKFKYDANSAEYIDQLFSYTTIQMDIKSIQIESGYSDFFSQKIYQNYLHKLKYLNLENNIIGSQKEKFNDFLSQLKSLNNLEILNLSDNALGAINGNLKLLGNEILGMKQLKYVNLENNLIGAYKDDSREFVKSIQKVKRLGVNLNYNLD